MGSNGVGSGVLLNICVFFELRFVVVEGSLTTPNLNDPGPPLLPYDRLLFSERRLNCKSPHKWYLLSLDHRFASSQEFLCLDSLVVCICWDKIHGFGVRDHIA